jgi:hypothetical protein
MKTFAGDLEGCSGVYRGGLNQNANHERARSNRYLDLFAGSEGRFAKPLAAEPKCGNETVLPAPFHAPFSVDR